MYTPQNQSVVAILKYFNFPISLIKEIKFH